MDTCNSEERLEKIFDNVNNWLKFIELKNVAILTLSATILAILCKMDFNSNCILVNIMFRFCIVVFSVTLLIAVYSLSASLDRKEYRDLSNNVGKNLYFYGDLSKMVFREYMSAYDVRYKSGRKDSVNGFTYIEEDLINQILINSRIAMRKGRCFNKSVKIIFGGAIIELLLALLYFVVNFLKN